MINELRNTYISKTKHTDTFSIVHDMDMEYEYDKRLVVCKNQQKSAKKQKTQKNTKKHMY